MSLTMQLQGPESDRAAAAPGARDVKRTGVNRTLAVLLATVVVLLSTTVFSVLTLRKEYNASSSRYDSIVWGASHTRTELSLFLAALDTYVLGTSGMSQAEFQQRYNYLKQRLPVFLQAMRSDRDDALGAGDLASGIQDRLRANDARLHNLEAGDYRAYNQLRNDLLPLFNALQQLSNSSELTVTQSRADRLRPIYLELLISAIATMAAAALLVLLPAATSSTPPPTRKPGSPGGWRATASPAAPSSRSWWTAAGSWSASSAPTRAAG
jgi:hypothetical protein